MINIIVEPELLLGGTFGLVMLILYGLRFAKPEIANDGDVFITTLGLIYSSIIIVHGWRLDPVLFFSQFLLNSITFYFLWLSIRQRDTIRRLKS